ARSVRSDNLIARTKDVWRFLDHHGVWRARPDESNVVFAHFKIHVARCASGVKSSGGDEPNVKLAAIRPGKVVPLPNASDGGADCPSRKQSKLIRLAC